MLMTENNTNNSGHIYVLPTYLAVLWDRESWDTWLYKRVRLSLFEWVLLPVNINGNHWALLVAHVRSRTVSLVDFMPEYGRRQRYVTLWKTFMEKRSRAVDENLEEWRDGGLHSHQQQDGHSCGLHVLLNAIVLARGQSLDVVTQGHIELMRNYVLHSLLKHATSPPSQRLVCDMLACTNEGARRWVCCNVCGRWCHFNCVGITTEPNSDYVCPICTAQYE